MARSSSRKPSSSSASAPRAAIYARISDDPLGKEAGVTRQLEDGRELVKQRGWTLVGEPLVDNDLSAFKGARRPGYEQLMQLVDAKQVDKVVVFQTSRLWRNRKERADGIDRLRLAGVGLCPVKGAELDLGTASGRVFVGLLGEFDTFESEVKSERVARAARQRAEQGRPQAQVPYGWKRIRERDSQDRVMRWYDVEDPHEGAIVREIVDRILAGDPIIAISGDLNARGVPSPTGKGPWLRVSVRQIALRETNVARSTFHGQILEGVQGDWPALVDLDKHERVKALLNDPARITTRGGARRHLLSYGVGQCGVCGSNLVCMVGTKRRKTPDVNGELRVPFQSYACRAKHCVSRDATYVDELVSQVVAARLGQPDAADLLSGDDSKAKELREQAAGLRARLDTAADDYADGTLTREQLRRITGKLVPQIEQLETHALTAAGPSVQVLDGLVARPDVRAIWDALPVARKAAVLEALRLRVVLLPTGRRGRGFDPESVRIDWSTG